MNRNIAEYDLFFFEHFLQISVNIVEKIFIKVVQYNSFEAFQISTVNITSMMFSNLLYYTTKISLIKNHHTFTFI